MKKERIISNHPNKSLEKLINNTYQYLKDKGYSQTTMNLCRSIWRRFAQFAGKKEFSQDLISQFLKNAGPHGQYMYSHLLFLLRFYRQGFVLHNQHKDITILSKNLEKLLLRFENYCIKHRGLCKVTVRTRMSLARRFLVFFTDNYQLPLKRLNHPVLDGFLKTLSHLNKVSLSNLLQDLKCFLRFLWIHEYLEQDMSIYLPVIRFAKGRSIPAILSTDQINSILSVIDRASPKGKRDYAMLILAARLGLRSIDIRTLELENLNWERSTIEITQSKTYRPLVLPIQNEVGEALIDYLRNGRPKSEHREVFLWACDPYKPLSSSGTMSQIIDQYRKRANIPSPPLGKRGMHTLRHSLASEMINREIPLTTISGILGHSTERSTHVYTKINITALRTAALNPEQLIETEVSHA